MSSSVSNILTLSAPEKSKNSIFKIPIIPQNLSINKERNEREHSCSTHTKLRKTNISHSYVCVSGAKKCYLYGKFCVRTT